MEFDVICFLVACLLVILLGLNKQCAVRKALFFNGCESRPATFAPAGSNQGSRGGNEAAEASDVEGP